jgi:hypothetical protein
MSLTHAWLNICVLRPPTILFVSPASTYRFILCLPQRSLPHASPVFSSPSFARPAGSDADTPLERRIRHIPPVTFTPADNGSRASGPTASVLQSNLIPSVITFHYHPPAAPRPLLLLLPIPSHPVPPFTYCSLPSPKISCPLPSHPNLASHCSPTPTRTPPRTPTL